MCNSTFTLLEYATLTLKDGINIGNAVLEMTTGVIINETYTEPFVKVRVPLHVEI